MATSLQPVIGKPAPDFTLPSTTGENISLRQFKGKKTVILYFYPKDETPGCTREACDLRDHSSELETAGTVVLGVSTDGLGSPPDRRSSSVFANGKNDPAHRARWFEAPIAAPRGFHPAYVPSGTATSGVRMPPSSFPSASTFGTSVMYGVPKAGGCVSMIPSLQNRGPKSRRGG